VQEERIAFLAWLETLIHAEGQKPRRAISFDLVHSMIRSRRLSVTREIDWLIARISYHCSDLRRFRIQAVLLNEAFWRGDREQVWQLLKELEEEFGASIWLIEMRLAFEQFYNGLEAQKAYLSEVKRTYPGGLPAYIAHFPSIRNEVRSSIGLFSEEVIKRLTILNLKNSQRFI
jgi:hypothetical protein